MTNENKTPEEIEAEKLIADQVEKKNAEMKQEVKSLIKESIAEISKEVSSLSENVNKYITHSIEEKKSAPKFHVNTNNVNTFDNNQQDTVIKEEVKSLVERQDRYIEIKSLGQRKNILEKKLFCSNQEEVKSYNSFNNIYGGYGVAPTQYMGTIDINRLAYAPVLELSRQVVSNLQGGMWIGEDYSAIDLADGKELSKATEQERMKLAEVVITPEELNGKINFSNKLLDMQAEGSLRYDVISNHQAKLLKILDRKANVKIMKYLKSQIGSKIKTYTTTGASGDLLLNDIFEIQTNALKDDYLTNAVFLTNKSTLLKLAKEVGTNGQYIWRDIIKNVSANLVQVSSPLGSVMILGISSKAQEKFEEIGAGAKIGIFADFNELIYSVYKDMFRVMKIFDYTEVDGYKVLYERTYFGTGITNSEAGVGVVIKS